MIFDIYFLFYKADKIWGFLLTITQKLVRFLKAKRVKNWPESTFTYTESANQAVKYSRWTAKVKLEIHMRWVRSKCWMIQFVRFVILSDIWLEKPALLQAIFLCLFYLFIFIYSFIHICIYCLGHFFPLFASPYPSTTLPSLPGRTCSAIFCNYVEEKT
jgi:hypothetical protein